MSNSLVSVIMPAFNRAETIKEALDSIKLQLYRPIEVIMVDDGSTDATRDAVEAWAAANVEPDGLEVHCFYQDNAGPGAARNRGMREASGEFIQFLDSDDRLHPERLARLALVFEECGAEFIQTGFEGFCADCGQVIETRPANPDADQFELALRGRLWPNTLRCAMRRELVERSPRWDEEMTCFEDYKYVAGLLARSEKSVAIPDILASARRGGGPRVSDRLRTHEGRGFRIRAEEELAKGIPMRPEVAPEAIAEFKSRLYTLAFRSAASGWPDHASRAGELAEGLDAPLDALGRRRRLVYRLGPSAARIYRRAHRIKKWFQGRASGPDTHRCLEVPNHGGG